MSNASGSSAITMTFTNLKEKSTAKMILGCFTRQFAENAIILSMEMLLGKDLKAGFRKSIEFYFLPTHIPVVLTGC